jgi:mycothiol synthase
MATWYSSGKGSEHGYSQEASVNKKHTVNLAVRNYRGEEDIAALAALFGAAAEVDGPHYGGSENDTRQTMTAPRTFPQQNVFLFEADGRLVGYGRVQLDEGPKESVFVLRGMVHPKWRRQGIGTRLMERLEQRVQERLDEATNERVLASVWCNLEHQDRRALFQKMGYSAVRYFFEMERLLRKSGIPVELPEPVYPPGIMVQSMAERPDLQAVWKTCDEAFRDHWGHTESRLEDWEHWTATPDHRPELWLVARDSKEDTAVGVCLNGIDPDYNARLGRQEGWIHTLAVRRPFRGQGLGRALLLAGMHLLQQEGMHWAKLRVDSENLSGALRLYESVGFQSVLKSAAFRKVVRSPRS